MKGHKAGDLTEEALGEICKTNVCPVLGVKLDWPDSYDPDHTCLLTQPSLDRIDSKKGYTKDNCRIVSLIVNYAAPSCY